MDDPSVIDSHPTMLNYSATPPLLPRRPVHRPLDIEKACLHLLRCFRSPNCPGSSKGSVLMGMPWFEINSAACFNSAKYARARMHCFKIAFLSNSKRGGRSRIWSNGCSRFRYWKIRRRFLILVPYFRNRVRQVPYQENMEQEF